MTDNSEPGRRDFLNEDPQESVSDDVETSSRRADRPEQDEAQLSAALGNAIDQIWSELDGLQRDREAGGRGGVRLPQADVPTFLRTERPQRSDFRRERAATEFTPASRPRRPRRGATEEEPVFGRESRANREGASRPSWRDDASADPRLPAPLQLDDLDVEEPGKRQSGPVIAGVLVAFMLAGCVALVATNVWSLRDTLLGLTPDEGTEIAAASTAPSQEIGFDAGPDEKPSSKTAAEKGPSVAALNPAPTPEQPQPPLPEPVQKRVNGTAGSALELGFPSLAESESGEVRISGLPASARLSPGREIAPGEWSVPSADLAAVSVNTPPEAFGVFEVKASLRRENGQQHPLGLVWLVLASPPTPIASATPSVPEPVAQTVSAPAAEPNPAETKPTDTRAAVAADPKAIAPAVQPSPEPAPPPAQAQKPPQAEKPQKVAAATPATSQPAPPRTSETAPLGGPPPSAMSLTTDEIQDLLTRGTKFFGEGNMAPARLLFRRAAEAGEPLGLLLLGMTYDPVEYERRGVVGLSSDAARAMDYYEKARAAGVEDASQRITALNNWTR